MKYFFCYISLGFTSALVAQNRPFLIHYNKAECFKYELHSPSNAPVELINFNSQEIAGALVEGFNEYCKDEERSVLEQDSILNRICNSGVLTFGKNRFTSKKNWEKEARSIDYALKLSRSPYRKYKSYGFKVDLLNLSQRGKFYFDRRNADAELQLYEGSYPKIRDEEHEDYVEPIPVKARTEIQMFEFFMEIFKKQGGLRALSSKAYSQIGLGVKLDQRSLFTSRRPVMYVMVMISGKKSEVWAEEEPFIETID